jgi:pimeloyl-ACP methyl ester carboxylesterase
LATYVLVHGAGHGGWCYQRVARILRGAGHEVYTPTLTGLGERAHLVRPDTDLDTHITDVVAVLDYEDLHDVILAGHSYAGAVITGAADRAADRVACLVYLEASLPRDGESLVDRASVLMAETYRHSQIVDGVELVLFPGPDTIRNYGVTDPDDVAWLAGKLTPHPWKTFAQPLRLTNEAALARIPRAIVCSVSSMQRYPNAVRFTRATDADRVWEIEASHDLMVTHPEAVAEILMQLDE